MKLTTIYEVLCAIQARNNFVDVNPKLHDTNAVHVLAAMNNLSYHQAYKEIQTVLELGLITYGSSITSPWLTKEGNEFFLKESERDVRQSIATKQALSFTTK